MSFYKTRQLFFLFSLVLVLSACGSSGSDDLPAAPADVVPPKVEDVFPEINEGGIEPDQKIEVTFTERMDLASLNFDSVKLYSGEKTANNSDVVYPRRIVLDTEVVPSTTTDLVTGDTIDSEATKLVIAPESGRFSLGTTYTVVISTDAKDLVEDDLATPEDESNYMENEFRQLLHIQDGEWQGVDAAFSRQAYNAVDEQVEILDQDVYDSHIASNSLGKSVLAWKQMGSSSSVKRLWISEYLSSIGVWRPLESSIDASFSAERLDIQESDVFAPQVAVNDDGKVIVIWHQADASASETNLSLWIRTYESGSWGQALNLTPELAVSAHTGSSNLEVDQQGNILVAWLEVDGGGNALKTRYYDASPTGTGWGDEVEISVVGGGSVETLDIISSDLPVYTLVWTQKVLGLNQLFSSRFFKSGDWGDITRIDSSDDGGISEFSIAEVSNGDQTVFWSQYDGKRYNIWSNYFAGGSWGVAQLRETDNRGDADSPVVVVGGTDETHVLWRQDDLTDHVLKYMSRSLGGEWSAVTEMDEASEILLPRLSFDNEGNGFAMWQEGERTTVSNRYIRGSGWLGEEFIGAQGGPIQSINLVSFGEDGRALGVSQVLSGGLVNHVVNYFSD